MRKKNTLAELKAMVAAGHRKAMESRGMPILGVRDSIGAHAKEAKARKKEKDE